MLDTLSGVEADAVRDYLDEQAGLDVTTERDAVRLLHVVERVCVELNDRMRAREEELLAVQEEENRGLLVASDAMKRGLEKNREYVEDIRQQQRVIDGLMEEVEVKQHELEDRTTQLKRLQRESEILRERDPSAS